MNLLLIALTTAVYAVIWDKSKRAQWKGLPSKDVQWYVGETVTVQFKIDYRYNNDVVKFYLEPRDVKRQMGVKLKVVSLNIKSSYDWKTVSLRLLDVITHANYSIAIRQGHVASFGRFPLIARSPVFKIINVTQAEYEKEKKDLAQIPDIFKVGSITPAPAVASSASFKDNSGSGLDWS